jgi:NADP-dependent 3-hydroxy acid dehydrogenase YdfG
MQVATVTEASSGIGQSTAIQIAKRTTRVMRDDAQHPLDRRPATIVQRNGRPEV